MSDQGDHAVKRKGSRPGGALPLQKYASARVSKYNKKDVLDRQQDLRVRKFSKFKKLEQRLQLKGLLGSEAPRDRISEVEELERGGPPSLPQPTQPKKQKRKPTPDQDAEQGSSPAEPSVGRASGAQKQRTAASAAAAVAGGSSSVHRATHSGGANAPPAGFRPDARATEKHSKAPHSVEGQGTDGKHSQAQRPARPLSQLQRIAGQVQASKSEDQKRREELARVQQRAQFQKKTRKGQPVMSVRIDKMLSVLQGNA
ncbi:MAG: hypothetical protein WDW38_008604 [Sanguina aurantia]